MLNIFTSNLTTLETYAEIELLAIVDFGKKTTAAETFNVKLSSIGLVYDSYYGTQVTSNGVAIFISADKKHSRHIVQLLIKKVSADCYFYKCIISGSSTQNGSTYITEADKSFVGFAYGAATDVGLGLVRNAGIASISSVRVVTIRR